MIWYSLKLAFRNISKNKHAYILNVVGIVIALTVCFITLFYTVFEHNYERYKFNTDNVFIVHEKDKVWDWPSKDIPLGLSHHLANNIPGVKTVVNYKENNNFHIQVDKNNVFKEWSFHFVDSNYMNFINKSTVTGDCLLKNPNDILLTKKIALKYFGTTDCIGKKITVHGHQNKSLDFYVSGVFDYPSPRDLNPNYNLVARLDIFNRLDKDFDYGNHKTKTYAYLVLDKTSDLDGITEQIQNYYIKNIDENYLKNKTIELITPKTNHFQHVGKRVNTAIVISLIILLVALINFIIHNNAQFWERSRSVGINKIVGSKPYHIFNLSFSEFFIINFISIVVAFFLAIVIIPIVKKYLNESINVEFLPLTSIFFIGIALAFLISLLTSLSSLYMSTRQPVKLVMMQLSRGVKGKLVNSSLIILQVGVTTFLMILLFATSRQLKYVQDIDWGFDAEEVMYIKLNEDLSKERFTEFKEQVQAIPGVISASGCWHVPPSGDKFFIGYFGDNGEKIMIDRNTVDYPYLKTLGIKLKSGRDFNKKLDKPSQKIIVNQEFLNIKNIKNPYDTLLKLDDRYAAKQIIGVVDKYHMRGMYEKITPQIFELNPNQSRNFVIKISPENVMQTLSKIESVYKTVLPNIAYKMGFIEDDIQNLYEGQKNFNTLISYYTIISLIIACMGLFGFVFNEMNKRIKEVGIRKVNGAKISELFSFLNQEFLLLSLLGFFISSPLAWHFSRKWSENFAYRTDTAWWIFFLVAISILFIVFVTVSIQTINVARRNPVEALRYE